MKITRKTAYAMGVKTLATGDSNVLEIAEHGDKIKEYFPQLDKRVAPILEKAGDLMSKGWDEYVRAEKLMIAFGNELIGAWFADAYKNEKQSVFDGTDFLHNIKRGYDLIWTMYAKQEGIK